MQDKFRLDLSDEEAVHYMQSLIDESVGALFAAVVEQIHKFAQVGSPLIETQRVRAKKTGRVKPMNTLTDVSVVFNV